MILHTILTGCTHFNPLPPHGGRRVSGRGLVRKGSFQSTPSAWRETLRRFYGVPADRISIHSLRMEGDRLRTLVKHPPLISIHSLRMEGDYREGCSHGVCSISIHSLRMEGDLAVLRRFCTTGISIHSLRMEGDIRSPTMGGVSRRFQSTPSAWRETFLRQDSSCSI